ncbi:MAG TPA: FAD-binding oxidoreductase [Roseiarcus sp.]
MQNDALSHGLWEMTASPAPPTSPLHDEVRADVAIIGCGYTGLSTALHCAQAGAKVVALEAVEIGFGGAGRNVGLVNAGLWLAPDDVATRLGPGYGERLLKLLGDGPSEVEALVTRHGLDCEFVRNGTLHCAIGQAGLAKIEQRCAQWSARGAPVKLLSREETARRIGVDIYAGSLLDLRAGTIQPLAYARGLARVALATGAAIHTQSAVRSAERTGKAWRLKTDGGTVTADWIVVATDAYAASGPWPQGKREQIRVPYFNFATRPLSAELRASILPGREGCWDTRMIMNSFRFDGAGRLLFGSIGALRAGGLEVHRAWAKRALKKTFPQVHEVAFEAQWYGMMGMTGNALPRFHRLAPNVVSFCGYNGRGIGTGTVFGRLLADHILGRLSEKDLPLPVTDPDAPALPALREAYYEAGAQIAHAVGARL